jgi:hypothetical protein
MRLLRLFAGGPIVLRGVIATLLSLLAPDLVIAADQFPFDQELLLDVAPMRPAKRVPILTVAPDGKAAIDLWCRSITAQVELSDTGIKIEPGPLPEALPELMSNGQCTLERIQADQDLLASMAQVTAWHMQGVALMLVGAKPLRFRPATN